MRNYLLFFILLVGSVSLLKAQTSPKTTGDNSPAIIARELAIQYGVRADAIEAILWVYQAEGYDEARRKRALEEILNQYKTTPEKKGRKDELSENTVKNLGLATQPQIVDALRWDLYAQTLSLSTTGNNSPTIAASGDVKIWYGIPEKALRALVMQLDKHKTEVTDFEVKLIDQVKKYQELKEEQVKRIKTFG